MAGARRHCRPGACPATPCAIRGRRAAETREAAFAGATDPGSAGVAVGRADVAYVAPGNALQADLAAAVDPGGLRREVFGFLPYWELTDSSTRLDWEKLSTIAYFGVGAAANGDLQRRDATAR